MSAQNKSTATEEYILGPEGIPFFTKRWYPADAEPKAYVVFVHGFAEHIQRYDPYFHLLAANGIHVLAFDKRGHGRTSQQPLDDKAEQVIAWRKDGKTVHLQKGMKGRNGGWAKAMPDIEFMVKRESERATQAGKKLFLYGHSMGGAEVLGFALQKSSKDALTLLAGVISSGPFIQSAQPLNPIQVKAGQLFAAIGLGNFLMTSPLEVNHLTHDKTIVEATSADPMCEPQGSLRTLSDMLSGGTFLDSKAAWSQWPVDLPLLVYIGGDDMICSPSAAMRFGENVVANDKTSKLLDGLYHEPHNEVGSARADLSTMVGEWILKRAGEDQVRSKL